MIRMIRCLAVVAGLIAALAAPETARCADLKKPHAPISVRESQKKELAIRNEQKKRIAVSRVQKNKPSVPKARRLAVRRKPAKHHGAASWYSRKDRGVRRLTASGEVFDDAKRTCAAWNFPFGTRLKVTNLKNGKSVVCRVNDRGPRKTLGRKIDLSKSAFRKIADLRTGLIHVSVVPVF